MPKALKNEEIEFLIEVYTRYTVKLKKSKLLNNM